MRDLLRADAGHLPLRDACIDVIVADPPYAGRNRGKRGISPTKVGYIPFSGRDWFHDAMRVLKPSGHLYLFSAIRELPAWLSIAIPVDIAYWRRTIGGRIAWYAPNMPSLMTPAWRPIIHYQKEPLLAIEWPGAFVHPDFFQTPAVQSNMREALPWPNQLPLTLLRWLLSPHTGLVLDLFAGTGTTTEAAINLGLTSIAIDASLNSLVIAGRRSATLPMFPNGPKEVLPRLTHAS